MTPADFLWRVVLPGLDLLPPAMDTPSSRCQLMATAGVESHWRFRQQIGGPARGYYQCELRGGVADVLGAASTSMRFASVCRALDIEPNAPEVYEAIAWCDPLATVLARLILWLDPAPLPAIGDADGAWACYDRCWRPGRPAPERWSACYAAALEAVAAPAVAGV